MATPEKKVKDKVKKILEKLGCYYFFPATGGFGKSGVPDIVICFKGHFVAIECKAGDNKPTALQEMNMKKIRESGGSTIVINEANLADVEEWLTGTI
jgi:Holliday junction resolvase